LESGRPPPKPPKYPGAEDEPPKKMQEILWLVTGTMDFYDFQKKGMMIQSDSLIFLRGVAGVGRYTTN